MREKQFIETIKSVIGTKYIGDDCAHLKDLGLTVTQDNLVEGVHFLREKIHPYQLGWKSVAVNVSDICASGAKPKYLTIGLSLPDDVGEDFVKSFYEGASECAIGTGGTKIVGGDITKSDKIMISVAAIGNTRGRRISSRSCAKVGQKIVISGEHGSSRVGLGILLGEKFPNLLKREKEYFVKFHCMPKAQVRFSKHIATNDEKEGYAMMDTSDGLADALSQIATSSEVMLEIDFNKIPIDYSIKKIKNFEEFVLFGGEDYGLIATTRNVEGLCVIGEVREGSGVKINYGKNRHKIFTAEDIETKIFHHFEE